jgi:hypothetical protein
MSCFVLFFLEAGPKSKFPVKPNISAGNNTSVKNIHVESNVMLVSNVIILLKVMLYANPKKMSRPSTDELPIFGSSALTMTIPNTFPPGWK